LTTGSEEQPISLESLPCEEQVKVLKARVDELREIETKRIEFTKAGDLKSKQQEIWVHAIEALPFFVKLRKARDHAIDDNKPWAKIIFQISEEGKVLDLLVKEDES